MANAIDLTFLDLLRWLTIGQIVRPSETFQSVDRISQRVDFRFFQPAKPLRQQADSPAAAFGEQLQPPGRGFDASNTAILRIGSCANEATRCNSRTRWVIVGGRTCSVFARSPSVIGPPKTMTDSAESFGAVSPVESSTRRNRRSR